MKLKASLVIGVLALGLAAVVAVATPSAQAKTGGSYTLPGAPWTGTATAPATVNGAAASASNITVTGFKVINGVINAVGTFTGSVAGIPGDNGILGDSFTTTFTAPVSGLPIGGASTAAAAANGSCPILDLTLGPLHLDLLGLVVDLNQVHLQITAQSGPGNLLGNLLCSVAGLLDNTGTGGTGGLSGLLQSITNLLNQILAQL